ncbi:hypothetical protein IAQ61_011921 [Plenodomus lingam]|uniref:uncharacterized protein n=1 Tax=Leptosphaeria maculans TaxID=5022 RepID=UPI0033324A2D|nr:hypothetical protein IAQ61_011921 [Plenodomus lingam]
MSVLPVGHPSIPSGVSIDDLVAIITIHDPEAIKANRNTPYQMTQILSQRPGRITRGSLEGCHIFLHKVQGQAYYTMGRADSPAETEMPRKRDIYLTDKQAAIFHLRLEPIQASNAWRIQNSCAVLATVNGVPIQCSSARKPEDPERLPCAVYLRQDTVNRLTIRGLRVDIWLLKTVQEAYPTDIATISPIDNAFAHRSEPWAQRDLFLLKEQVSHKSHRVLHRFTGETFTAKVFRDAPNRWQLRANEFQKFARDQVDASIVRYRAELAIDNIPAVITDTHYGLMSYAAMQSKIQKMHPGHRFLIAAKLQRRLFSALDFLHFHGILHGSVTLDAVLIRLLGHKVATVLLVDYSAATSVPLGAEISRLAMLEDARTAMEIVEDCCNIWKLRKKPSEEAESDEMLVRKIATAQEDVDLIKRVVNDFLAKGGDKYSKKYRKLLDLVEEKRYDLQMSQNRRKDNAKRVAIAPCRQSLINDMIQDWTRTQPPFKIGETAWMHLTLGHPYFDNLTNELRYNRWESTPREICTQFKNLAGEIEEPWQSILVLKPLSFGRCDGQFVEEQILMWLASCCEIFPAWRHALETEYSRCVDPCNGLIKIEHLRFLQDALSKRGNLPTPMCSTFKELLAPIEQDQSTLQSKALHHVTLHAPSNMFNLTQLQRLTGPERFVKCVQDPNSRCDTFVEVRGEPSLQGCYAPLALLSQFVQLLGLSLLGSPKISKSTPMHDPADFSQVPAGRIVLARTGLVAFASMTRGGNQCVFYAPRIPKPVDLLCESTFFATYFGNMKILPDLTDGKSRYERPAHWSKFRTAEEQESATDWRRQVMAAPARNFSAKRNRSSMSSPCPNGRVDNRSAVSWQSSAMEVYQSPLRRMLKVRERRRAQAFPPTKRNVDAQNEEPNPPSEKRSRISPGPGDVTPTRQKPEPADAHVKMVAERLAAMADVDNTDGSPGVINPLGPRGDGAGQAVGSDTPCDRVFDLPYLVQEGKFDITADRKKAEKWLTDMEAKAGESEKNSPPVNAHLSLLRIPAPSVTDSDATVAVSLDEAVLNKHRAALRKGDTSNVSIRQGMNQVKCDPRTPRHTVTKLAGIPEDEDGEDEILVFSPPTPLVSDWLGGLRRSRRARGSSESKDRSTGKDETDKGHHPE